jgi:hypothetical protein
MCLVMAPLVLLLALQQIRLVHPWLKHTLTHCQEVFQPVRQWLKHYYPTVVQVPVPVPVPVQVPVPVPVQVQVQVRVPVVVVAMQAPAAQE